MTSRRIYRRPYWGPPLIEWSCKRAGITYISADPDCPCCEPLKAAGPTDKEKQDDR